jgi:hypothetical protein
MTYKLIRNVDHKYSLHISYMQAPRKIFYAMDIKKARSAGFLSEQTLE